MQSRLSKRRKLRESRNRWEREEFKDLTQRCWIEIVQGLENFHHDTIISRVRRKSQFRYSLCRWIELSFFQYIRNLNVVDRSLSIFLLPFLFSKLSSQNKMLIIFFCCIGIYLGYFDWKCIHTAITETSIGF